MSAVPQIVKSLSKEVAPALPQFMEQPGLFSKIADVTRRLNFSKMDSRQLNKTLMGKGVTLDEIADTLGGLSGTVSKQQVLDRIGERGVRTEDVVLGAPERTLNPVSAETLDSKFEEFFKDAYDNLKSVGTYSDLEAQQFAQEQARNNIMRWKDINHPTELTKPTHYSTWVLPGAKEGSYREMFVTAPSKKSRIPTFDEYLKYYDENGYISGAGDIEAARNAYSQDAAEGIFENGLWNIVKNKDNVKTWADGHSGYENIQNPIVRIRFNDREVGPEGKKILFVEEIQGPQGDQKFQFKDADMKFGSIEDKVFETKQEALDYAKKYRIDPSRIEKVIEDEQGKMPPALQERIYDIGVKRIIAYAKEHGYDGVAWTPGKMQADRYNLAKQIDSLRITKFPSGTYHIGASKGNTPLLVEEGVSESDLPRYIGKELAGKAITQLGNKNTGQVLFEGLDLEIGGEGLKNLYDVRIPSLFKKYGKSEIKEAKIYSFDLSKHSAASMAKLAGVQTNDPGLWWSNLPQKQRDYFIDKVSNITVPYIPITKDTPSRFPLYSIPPALLTAGFGAKEFGPEYFSNKRAARMRQS